MDIVAGIIKITEIVFFVALLATLGTLAWVVNSQERTEWLSARILRWKDQ
jgi:hypothetical protein